MAEWKWVPVEPTKAMIDAGHMHTMRADEEEPYRARGEAIACYSDMLAASPPAPAVQPAGAKWSAADRTEAKKLLIRLAREVDSLAWSDRFHLGQVIAMVDATPQPGDDTKGAQR